MLRVHSSLTLATARVGAPEHGRMKKLAGRVALITGAGSGLGAAAARLLALEGARVGLLSRTASELEKLERETVVKGLTLVVTSIYWKNGRIKFEIGVAKGKKLYDKRETEMKKTVEKETRQQLKERLR